jgi:hypothetical protein
MCKQYSVNNLKQSPKVQRGDNLSQNQIQSLEVQKGDNLIRSSNNEKCQLCWKSA